MMFITLVTCLKTYFKKRRRGSTHIVIPIDHITIQNLTLDAEVQIIDPNDKSYIDTNVIAVEVTDDNKLYQV